MHRLTHVPSSFLRENKIFSEEVSHAQGVSHAVKLARRKLQISQSKLDMHRVFHVQSSLFRESCNFFEADFTFTCCLRHSQVCSEEIAVFSEHTSHAQVVSCAVKFATKALQYSRTKLHKRRVSHVQSSVCLLYTSPSPRDQRGSRMPSSA